MTFPAVDNGTREDVFEITQGKLLLRVVPRLFGENIVFE
jgi:hypothetical protein